ncbi:MAG: dTDP-4-dehydrorhamnose 3,5-epimerase [Chitinophagales bacterium]
MNQAQSFIEQTGIEDLLILHPRVFADERGYFYESYNKQRFEANGLNYDFVQDNQARSTYGILRGLHFQHAPFAQTKLVRVTEGEVLDVVVDLRRSSATYGKSFSIVLSEENKLQFLIPQGFAHGYAVLSPTAVFQYKCDNYYSKEHEGGLAYDDPALQIDWRIPTKDIITSDRDKVWTNLQDLEHNF